jgi:hypothetical protein
MKQDDDAFLLSRIEAQGWNAAQRVMIGETRAPDDAAIARLNPHKTDPARARWHTGFKNAVERAAVK